MLEPLGRLKAVTLREIRDVSRRRTTWVVRTAFAAALGLVAFTVLSSGPTGDRVRAEQLSMVAYSLFGALTHVQAPLLLVLGCLLGIASARAEQRDRTLGLLVLSRLRAWEVIGGKTLALAALLVMAFAAALPLFGMIGWIGGLEYVWLGRSALLSVVLAFLGVSLGLLMGFLSRNVALAALAATMMAGFWLWLRLLWTNIGSYSVYAEVLSQFSPGVAVMTVASQGLNSTEFFHPLLVNSLLALLLIVLAGPALRYAAKRSAGRGLRGSFEKLDAFFEAINVGNFRIARRERRVERGNPVTWLARTGSGLGAGRYATRLALATFLFGLLVLSGMIADEPWAYVAAPPAVLLAGLIPLSSGAAAVAGERSRKSLVLLLATPMTARRILWGKTLAAVGLCALVFLPTMLLLLLIQPATDWTSPGWAPAPELVLSLYTFAAQAACAFALALGTSLFSRAPLRAGFSASGLLLAVNVVPPFAAGLLWAAFAEKESWAKTTVYVLAVPALVAVLLYFKRLRGRPGWDFLAFVLLLVGSLTLVSAIPFGGSSLFEVTAEALQGMLGRGWETEWLLFTTYVLLVGAAAHHFSVRRFDRFVGRST